MNDPDHGAEPVPETQRQSRERRFLHRVALVDGLTLVFILGLAAIWYTADALLLIFACILFAVLLYDISCRIARYLPIPRLLALAMLVLLLLGSIGGGGWLMAPTISEQAEGMTALVPSAIEQLRQSLKRYDFLESILGGMPSTEEIGASLSELLPRAGLFFRACWARLATP